MSPEGNRRKLFGTDGIRGIANQDLTPELAMKAGKAVVQALRDAGQPFIIVGRDTRLSGDMLASALTAGICSAGGLAADVGVLPTPAIAYLAQELSASAGIVVSASHNPMDYNGIKVFLADGFKLPDELELRVEELIESSDELPRPEGSSVGRVIPVEKAGELYLEHLRSICGHDLSGMRVVLDCANGAAFRAAPELYHSMGAEVSSFYDQPDGSNINLHCGSTRAEVLSELVRSQGGDVGLAFDGDADRVIFTDGQGNIVDGDYVLAICASHMKNAGRLACNTVVTTVMTNLGFRQAMERSGIEVIQTKVGDRYVLEEMLASGLNLGGEQSGHVIFLDHSTTGDGLITGLKVLEVMAETGKSLGELAMVMQRLPQVLLNVEVEEPERLMGANRVWEEVRRLEETLNGTGRILLRPSGTEPLVRVMVEHASEEDAAELAEYLAAAVRAEMGWGTR